MKIFHPSKLNRSRMVRPHRWFFGIESGLGGWILLLLLMSVSPINGAGTNLITLSWDYSSADIVNAGTNGYGFPLHASAVLNTNLAQWTTITNVSGDITNAVLVTNGLATFQQTLQVGAGQMFYYVTSSNMWGESTNSNLVVMPAVGIGPGGMRIRKGP